MGRLCTLFWDHTYQSMYVWAYSTNCSTVGSREGSMQAHLRARSDCYSIKPLEPDHKNPPQTAQCQSSIQSVQ